ncbi:ATP-binding protein [Streptomyces sp. RerS4]|nr:ATP-binding protein [Streptomyces sp. RerS4]
MGDTLAVWSLLERRDDIRLCASELAANAVQHGVPVGREFLVRLVREEAVLWIEVRDSGPGRPVVCHPVPEEGRGRGLLLVTELADELEIRDDRVGKSVRAGFKVANR